MAVPEKCCDTLIVDDTVPDATVADATVPDDSISLAAPSVKRTRRGEKFTPPTDVNLHANDFEWDDLFGELNDEDRTLYRTFHAKCAERLAEVAPHCSSPGNDGNGAPGTCDACYPPLGRHHAVADAMRDERPRVAVESLRQSPQTPPTSGPQFHDPQSWERHYATNKQHFPVKNYIVHAFPVLVPRCSDIESHGDALQRLCNRTDGIAVDATHPPPRIIMEAGCGTGSVSHPLMKLFPNDVFVCHDVSATAVAALLAHDAAQQHLKSGKLHAFVLDLTSDGHALSACMHASCPTIAPGSVDIAMLVFVLSAMPSFAHMVHVLRQIRFYLKRDTGRLLFRDYGALDHNFFRFHRQNNMFLERSLNFLKGDGTEQFFYDIATTEELFRLGGFAPANASGSIQYHCNRIVNRKNGKRMDKVFINGEFKPV